MLENEIINYKSKWWDMDMNLEEIVSINPQCAVDRNYEAHRSDDAYNGYCMYLKHKNEQEPTTQIGIYIDGFTYMGNGGGNYYPTENTLDVMKEMIVYRNLVELLDVDKYMDIDRSKVKKILAQDYRKGVSLANKIINPLNMSDKYKFKKSDMFSGVQLPANILFNIYRHFKKGDWYIILGFSEDVDDYKPRVIYQALYDQQKIYDRKFDEFFSETDKVKYSEAEQNHRFMNIIELSEQFGHDRVKDMLIKLYNDSQYTLET
jgi:hypothetical protein